MGKYTEVVFVDLKSAFDSVSHEILSRLIFNDDQLPTWFKGFVFKIYGNSFITPTYRS